MQTSNGHPLDLKDRGQGVDRRAPSHPDVYRERIARLQANADRAKAKRLGVIPCPEPRDANSPSAQLFRDSVSQGFRGAIDAWHGFTAEGRIMAAGVDFGRFFRLDDPRPILA